MVTAKSVDRISKRRGEILAIDAQATIFQAAGKMKDSQIGCLLALSRNGKVVGIVTERDIVAKVVAEGGSAAVVRVEDIMTRSVVSVVPGTPAQDAQRLMATHGIRHLPIIEKGVPVGMVSSRDLLSHQLSAVQAIVKEQSRVLTTLEKEHPGITRLETTASGRVVI